MGWGPGKGFYTKALPRGWNNNITAKYEWDTVSPASEITTVLTTIYSYDAFGNTVKMVNPAGEEFYYYYNAFGQLEKTTYNKDIAGIETTEESVYDESGNLIEYKDRAGNKMICEYNNLGQTIRKQIYKLINSTLTLEEETEIQYSQLGTPTQIIKRNGTGERQSEYQYAYNSLGQLATFNQFIGNESYYKHYSITNTYNIAGNLDITKLWDGEPGTALVKALDYDSAASESSVYEHTGAAKGDLIAKVKNRMWGGVDRIEYGANPVMTTNYTYNSLLQPTGITNTGRMELAYTYDFQGNVTGWTNGTAKTFTYDGLDRLLTETAGTITDKYFYDAIGNRTEFDKENDGISYTAYIYNPVKKMQLDNYSEDNQTWTFSYDANGNTTSKTAGITNWEYIYNSSNQLIEVKKVGTTIGRYEYDINGLRIRKTEDDKTTYYIYNGQSILFEETYDSTEMLEKYEYNIELSGMNLAKYNWDAVNDWQLTYHLNDHLGSRQIICDSAGLIINTNKYKTFGKHVEGVSNEAAFTGKKFENETGLYYFNARWYNEATGRFITLDPISDGVNWYVYCNNNPLRFIDTTGLFSFALPFPGVMVPYPTIPLVPLPPIVLIPTESITGIDNIDAPDCSVPGRYSSGIDWHDPPSSPNDLGPDWEETTDPNNDSGNRNFKNKKTGDVIRWDKGKQAANQKPHWHRDNPDSTGKMDTYLDKDGNPVPRNSNDSHIYPKSDFEKFIDGIMDFFTPQPYTPASYESLQLS